MIRAYGFLVLVFLIAACIPVSEPDDIEDFEPGDDESDDSPPTDERFPELQPASGTTLYVATDGSDTNPGTSQAPFRTIQHAADTAQPGDKVVIRPGVYEERVVITTSGRSDEPIIFEGEEGAVIDGGTRITGWEPAPEIGSGVYKINHGPWTPRNMVWNDKFVPELDRGIMNDGRFRTIMSRPSTDENWDRLPATYGNLDGTTYVRLQDGQNPETEDVAFAPFSTNNRAALRLLNADHIIVRGLTMRNAYRALQLYEANDNIIEHNLLAGGSEILEIRSGSARNHARHNEITLDYINPYIGNPTIGPEIYSEIRRDLKGRARRGDPNGVRIFMAGADNHIYGNFIHGTFDAVMLGGGAGDGWIETGRGGWVGNHRTMVYDNVILHTQDSGVELLSELTDSQFFNNIIAEAQTGFRIKSGFSEGPMYVYRNFIYNTNPQWYQGRPSGTSFYTWDMPGTLYFYHNTISNPRRPLSFGWNSGHFGREGNPYRAENLWFINNIFSSELGIYSGRSGEPRATADYNWIGGDLSRVLRRGWPEEQNNVFAPDERMWDYDTTRFELRTDSQARNAGIDLSQEWTLNGITHPALPGMTPDYFSGPAPDLGALQYGETTPPLP